MGSSRLNLQRHRQKHRLSPGARAGIAVMGVIGGGVRIWAKPNKMAALLFAFAEEHGHRGDAAPRVASWGWRQLPRIYCALDADEARDLLRWLAQLPASWPVQRLFRAVREAVLEVHPLNGCICD